METKANYVLIGAFTIIVAAGSPIGVSGTTNMLKILTV